jgi:hypothetical protein
VPERNRCGSRHRTRRPGGRPVTLPGGRLRRRIGPCDAEPVRAGGRNVRSTPISVASGNASMLFSLSSGQCRERIPATSTTPTENHHLAAGHRHRCRRTVSPNESPLGTAVPYGLSLEHAWSPGTVSLRIGLPTQLLNMIVDEYVRATPALKRLIVNGHGGNRGILEPALHELTRAYGVAAWCTLTRWSPSTPLLCTRNPRWRSGNQHEPCSRTRPGPPRSGTRAPRPSQNQPRGDPAEGSRSRCLAMDFRRSRSRCPRHLRR